MFGRKKGSWSNRSGSIVKLCAILFCLWSSIVPLWMCHFLNNIHLLSSATKLQQHAPVCDITGSMCVCPWSVNSIRGRLHSWNTEGVYFQFCKAGFDVTNRSCQISHDFLVLWWTSNISWSKYLVCCRISVNFKHKWTHNVLIILDNFNRKYEVSDAVKNHKIYFTKHFMHGSNAHLFRQESQLLETIHVEVIFFHITWVSSGNN